VKRSLRYGHAGGLPEGDRARAGRPVAALGRWRRSAAVSAARMPEMVRIVPSRLAAGALAQLVAVQSQAVRTSTSCVAPLGPASA
jgi:hypothetical protein